MTMYKTQLINAIKTFIDDNESNPKVYVQGNIMAAWDALEVIQGLNQMQACKVARAIAQAEARAEAPVHPVDYPAFARF